MSFTQINSSQTDAKSPINETLMDTGLRLNLDDHETRINNISGAELQDYIAIGSLGSSGQQAAGHLWTLTEPNIATAELKQLSLFKNGVNILKDETTNNNDWTDAGSVVTTSGIFDTAGDSNSIALDGATDYLTTATLLDTISNGIACMGWIKFTDGQPAGELNVFNKQNVSGQDRIGLVLRTGGQLRWQTEENNNGENNIDSNLVLPNGNTNWLFYCCSWNSTRGKEMYLLYDGHWDYVNDNAETTIMSNGTATDFTLGASTGGAGKIDGSMCMFMCLDKAITPKDVRIAASTAYAVPVTISGTDYKPLLYVKDGGNDDLISQMPWPPMEVVRSSSYIYRLDHAFDSSDKIRILVGE